MFEKFEYTRKTSNNNNTQEGSAAFKKVFGRNRRENDEKCPSEDDVDAASDLSGSESSGENLSTIVIQDSNSDEELLKSAIHDDENDISETKDADQQTSSKSRRKNMHVESSEKVDNKLNENEKASAKSPKSKKKSPKKKRKRVKPLEDSDSDQCSTPKKKQKNLKENNCVIKTDNFYSHCPNDLKKLKDMFPNRSKQDILTAINKTSHLGEAAIFLSNPYFTSPGKDKTVTKQNNNPPETIEIDSGDEDNDNINECDSDEESGLEEDDDDKDHRMLFVPKRRKILSFLNDCEVEELALIPGLSLIKANKLVNLRPFETWKDLETKLVSSKGNSKMVLENAYEYIKKRNEIQNLMKRCENISKDIEHNLGQLNEEMEQPVNLNPSCQLKPYQLIGLNWLKMMHEKGMNCILADEMGLGKTVQALSFIAHLIKEGDNGPYLIVAPASTVDNWVRELEHFYPSVKYLQYYGSQEHRYNIRHSIRNEELDFQVIIATYQTAISTYQDRNLFNKLETHYVVFDEGHMLKNMKSQRYQKLFNLRAKRRLLLTGTPIQNDLLELMSLLSFVMPNMFGTCEITDGLNVLFSSIKKNGENSSVRSYHEDRLQQASRILKPFVLRRLKKDVLSQLPQKTEEVVMVDLTDKQRQLYDKVFKECCVEYRKQQNKRQNLMMPLRLTSNHPLLLRNNFDDSMIHEMATKYCRDFSHRDSEVDLVYEDMTVMTDFELHRLSLEESSLSSYTLSQDVLLDSGKFNYLKDTLPKMKEKGDRVLLFSQFVLVMDVIEVFLKHHKYKFVRLDGSTKVSERLDLIDKFNNNEDIFIFLLSTRAGGLGINLASANVVILHDIDFNPYNDKQAEDRCHRVGQTRNVRVYKLISKGTIEEAILKCAKSKLKLEKDVVSTHDNGLELEESEDDLTAILEQTFKE